MTRQFVLLIVFNVPIIVNRPLLPLVEIDFFTEKSQDIVFSRTMMTSQERKIHFET